MFPMQTQAGQLAQGEGLDDWEAFYQEALTQELELAAALHGNTLVARDVDQVSAPGTCSDDLNADAHVRARARVQAFMAGPPSQSSEGSSRQRVAQGLQPKPRVSPYMHGPPAVVPCAQMWPQMAQRDASMWHDATHDEWQARYGAARTSSPPKPRRRSLGFDSYAALHQARQQPAPEKTTLTGPTSVQGGTRQAPGYMDYSASSWGHSSTTHEAGLAPAELIDACMDEMEEGLIAAMYSHVPSSSRHLTYISLPEHPIRQLDAVELLHKGGSPGRVKLFGPDAAFQVPHARARSPNRAAGAAGAAWSARSLPHVPVVSGAASAWRANHTFDTSRPHSPPASPGYASPQRQEWAERAWQQQQQRQQLSPPPQQTVPMQLPARSGSATSVRVVGHGPVTGAGLLEHVERREDLFFSPQAYQQFSDAPAPGSMSAASAHTRPVPDPRYRRGHADALQAAHGVPGYGVPAPQPRLHNAADVYQPYDQQAHGQAVPAGGKAASAPPKRTRARLPGLRQTGTSRTPVRRVLGYTQDLWEPSAPQQQQQLQPQQQPGPRRSSFSVLDVPSQLQPQAPWEESAHAHGPQLGSQLPRWARNTTHSSGCGSSGRHSARSGQAQATEAGPERLLATIEAIRQQSLGGGSNDCSTSTGAASQSHAWLQSATAALSSLQPKHVKDIAVAVMSGSGVNGSPHHEARHVPAVPNLSALTEQLAAMDSAGLDAVRGYASGFIDGRCTTHPEEFVHVRPHVVKDAVLRMVEAAMAAKTAQVQASATSAAGLVTNGASPSLAPPPANSSITSGNSNMPAPHAAAHVLIPTHASQVAATGGAVTLPEPKPAPNLSPEAALSALGLDSAALGFSPSALLAGIDSAAHSPTLEVSFAGQCGSAGSSPDLRSRHDSPRRTTRARGSGSRSQLSFCSTTQTPLELLAAQLGVGPDGDGVDSPVLPSPAVRNDSQHMLPTAGLDTEDGLALQQLIERRLSSDRDSGPLDQADMKPSASAGSLSEKLQRLLLDPPDGSDGTLILADRSGSGVSGGGGFSTCDSGPDSSTLLHRVTSGNTSGVIMRVMSSEQLVAAALRDEPLPADTACPDAITSIAPVNMVWQSAPPVVVAAHGDGTDGSGPGAASGGPSQVAALTVAAATPINGIASAQVATPTMEARCSADELVKAAEGIRESLRTQQAAEAAAAAAALAAAAAPAAAAAAATSASGHYGTSSVPNSHSTVKQGRAAHSHHPHAIISAFAQAPRNPVRKTVSNSRLQPHSFKRASAGSVDAAGHPVGGTGEGVVPGGFGSPTHPGSPLESPRPSFTGNSRPSSGSTASAAPGKRPHTTARLASLIALGTHHDGDSKGSARPTSMSRSSTEVQRASGSNAARGLRTHSSMPRNAAADLAAAPGAASRADHMLHLQAALQAAELRMAGQSNVSSMASDDTALVQQEATASQPDDVVEDSAQDASRSQPALTAQPALDATPAVLVALPEVPAERAASESAVPAAEQLLSPAAMLASEQPQEQQQHAEVRIYAPALEAPDALTSVADDGDAHEDTAPAGVPAAALAGKDMHVNGDAHQGLGESPPVKSWLAAAVAAISDPGADHDTHGELKASASTDEVQEEPSTSGEAPSTLQPVEVYPPTAGEQQAVELGRACSMHASTEQAAHVPALPVDEPEVSAPFVPDTNAVRSVGQDTAADDASTPTPVEKHSVSRQASVARGVAPPALPPSNTDGRVGTTAAATAAAAPAPATAAPPTSTPTPPSLAAVLSTDGNVLSGQQAPSHAAPASASASANTDSVDTSAAPSLPSSSAAANTAAAHVRTPSPRRGGGKDLKAIEPVLTEMRQIRASIPQAAVAAFVAAAATNTAPPADVAALITPAKLRRLAAALRQLSDFAAGLEAKRGEGDGVVAKLHVLHRDLARWAAPMLQPLGLGPATTSSAPPADGAASSSDVPAAGALRKRNTAASTSAGGAQRVAEGAASAPATALLNTSEGGAAGEAATSPHSPASLLDSCASEASPSGIPPATNRVTTSPGSDAASSVQSSPTTSPTTTGIVKSSGFAALSAAREGSGGGSAGPTPSFSFPPPASPSALPTGGQELALVTLLPPVAPEPELAPEGSKTAGGGAVGAAAQLEAQQAAHKNSLMAQQAAAMAAVTSRLGTAARPSQPQGSPGVTPPVSSGTPSTSTTTPSTTNPSVVPAGAGIGVDGGMNGSSTAGVLPSSYVHATPVSPVTSPPASPPVAAAHSGSGMMGGMSMAGYGNMGGAGYGVTFNRGGPNGMSAAGGHGGMGVGGSMSSPYNTQGQGHDHPQGMGYMGSPGQGHGHGQGMGNGSQPPTMGMGMGMGILAPFIAGGGVNSQLTGPNAYEAMMAASAQQQQQQVHQQHVQQQQVQHQQYRSKDTSPRPSTGSESGAKVGKLGGGGSSFKEKLGNLFKK